ICFSSHHIDDKVSLRREADSIVKVNNDSLLLQQQLSSVIEKSLYSNQTYNGDFIEKDQFIDSLEMLLDRGAQVHPDQLQIFFRRDGGGWSKVTDVEILDISLSQFLTLSYYTKEDKNYWLNRFLCDAILISDSGVVELLIRKVANPKEAAIWETLLNITPDYFPSYETMRLLVERLDYKLFQRHSVTPIWWLVYERNLFPEKRNSEVLENEMRKRKQEAYWVCNVEKEIGYFLDSELYKTSLNAWELAEYFNDVEVLKYKD